MRSCDLKSTLLPALVVALGLPLGAPSHAASPVREQLEFGVEMAKRGLWSEALFRFNQADDLDPSNPRILNTLAVAHEAVGQFEAALSIYQEAIKAAPGNAELKRNYAQFLEFYQGFRPREPEGETPADGSEETPAQPAADDESGGDS
jgi:Tfp pilus assembly protein PilF